MTSVEQLHNYILSKKPKLDILSIQFLVFFIEKWHLTHYQRPVSNASFEAWMHGPICRQIFSCYNTLYGFCKMQATEAASFSEDEQKLIDDVLTEYGKFSSFQLEKIARIEPEYLLAREGLNQLDYSTRPVVINTYD